MTEPALRQLTILMRLLLFLFFESRFYFRGKLGDLAEVFLGSFLFFNKLLWLLTNGVRKWNVAASCQLAISDNPDGRRTGFSHGWTRINTDDGRKKLEH
jgi:hypothetical protein